MRHDRYEMAKRLLGSGKIRVDVENGEVYSNATNKPMARSKTPYPTIIIQFEGKTRAFTIHQLVMVASGEDIRGVEINHINGNKEDNRRVNLEKTSRSKNIAHAWKLKRSKIGLEN